MVKRSSINIYHKTVFVNKDDCPEELQREIDSLIVSSTLLNYDILIRELSSKFEIKLKSEDKTLIIRFIFEIPTNRLIEIVVTIYRQNSDQFCQNITDKNYLNLFNHLKTIM